MGNLSSHAGASLYETLEPQRACALLNNFGSRRNIAEYEFSILSRQCWYRRIAGIDTLRNEISV